MKCKLNDYIIEYEVIRKDNKNLYFRFDDNCRLIITAPRFVTDKEVQKLISKNAQELLLMYENALERKERSSFFWYLGKSYNVVFDNRVTTIKFEDDTIVCHDENALNNFYLEECNKVFKEEIDICKKCFNSLPEFSFKIRKMRTRWGVCNTRTNTITLNSELLKKEIELIDYVIIHEMCHFFEQNHSKQFWNLVSMACPDYKEKRKKLKY